MNQLSLLAHGGTAGLAIEISLLLLPIVVFAILAKWSAKRSRAEDDAVDER